MAIAQHASKRSAQTLNFSNTSTPIKAAQSKIPKRNNEESKKKENKIGEEVNLHDIYNMMTEMMKKLEKLDSIEEKVKTFEQDLKSVKDSIEFAHAEVNDLKVDNETRKKMDEHTRQRLENLETENTLLNKSLIDLQARSMRDNLIFYNIPETKDEETTPIIHKLLEEKMGMKDATRNIKIDRSHRLGRPKPGTRKPRPIIAKFNYHQDRENIRRNAKKLKGTNIGIGEQFPAEIVKVRKELYPELKKAKDAGKKVKLVRDKLIIDGQVFKPTGQH